MNKFILLLILCFATIANSAEIAQPKQTDSSKAAIKSKIVPKVKRVLKHERKSKLKISLQLFDLETIKASEKVDELYMAVTSYPSKGRPMHRQIPAFPRYWLSTHLKQIKNLQLWKGSLREGDSVTVHLSLIERDAPPFNNDDLVATVLVKIMNSKGKLYTKWSMPNKGPAGKDVKVDTDITAKLFDLQSDEAHYKGKFSVIAKTIEPRKT